MTTTERHKHVSRHWDASGSKDLRSGEPMEESRGKPNKRDDKNQVMDVIRQDRRFKERAVGDINGIRKSYAPRILSDLSMTRACVLWVPRLIEYQMPSRASASKDIFKIQRKYVRFLNMTFNRHHELRFDVVGVALICIIGSIMIKILFTDKIH